MYYKDIDTNDKQAMFDFLTSHFRYYTMNSWNQSTSYAHNMKIYRLDVPRDIEDKLYKMLDCDEVYDEINMLIDDFNYDHDYEYQAAFNGKNGGYLVLYNGGKQLSDYKSFCPVCGQKNYQTATKDNNKCGVCKNERINYETPPYKIYTRPGQGIDEDLDFEEETLDSLREKVKIVQDFDRLADDIRDQVIFLAENYEIQDEEYLVPKTKKVLVPTES